MSKKETLAFIKSCSKRKIQNWKLNTLSLAGREVIIKVAVYAIPTYPMTSFFFPLTFCKEIDALAVNIWWGQRDDKWKFHWRNWDSISLPKKASGMGFKSLIDFNKALLTKQF